MRNLFNLILCLLSTVYTMAQDNNYNNYCSHLYDILNARVAISENFVKYQKCVTEPFDAVRHALFFAGGVWINPPKPPLRLFQNDGRWWHPIRRQNGNF